jgi:hypothetical protein
MRSLPGTERAPAFAAKIYFPLSGSFTIQWLAVGKVHVDNVRHIRNEYLENRPVTMGHDCQEIEPSAGRELCEYLARNMGRC